MRMKVIEYLSDLYKSIRSDTRCFVNDIKRWFAYYRLSRIVTDFDYEGVFEVERFQIKRLRDSIEKYGSHVNAPRDVRHMNLALRLLDIVQEDGCAEYHGKDIVINENGRVEFDKDSYYTMPVYVNTRNSKRFLSHDSEFCQDFRHGAIDMDRLRVQKAWVLYHKVRCYFMRSWWD